MKCSNSTIKLCFRNKFNSILSKTISILVIITNLTFYIPVISSAADDAEDIEEKYPAIVPTVADTIISKYISTPIRGGVSSASGDVITDYADTGDGWNSITTVEYPNGTKRTFRNYKQYEGSYADESFWGGKIKRYGCGPSSVAIILSGYGINANPLDVVNAFSSLGYNYTSTSIIQEVLEKKYNIKSKLIKGSSSTVEEIRNNFKSGRPVIAGVPNHFITFLGEDSSGKVILSDAGYSNSNWGDTIEEYVDKYPGRDVILITSDGKASSSTNTKSSNKSTTKSSSNSNQTLRWPVGSNNITTKGGKKFAFGTPELTTSNVSRGGVSRGWSTEGHPKNEGEALDIAGNGTSGVYNAVAMGSGTVTSCGDGLSEDSWDGNRRNGKLCNY